MSVRKTTGKPHRWRTKTFGTYKSAILGEFGELRTEIADFSDGASQK
jgi:hypothetical protein